MTEPIFKSVRFYTTGDIPRKVEELLESGGARREAYFTDYTTHLIVGDNPDETVVNEAHDLYERPALRSFWVVMCQHAGRMLPPTGFVYTTGALFADLVVTCSQLTREDVSTVWAVVTGHGGRFRCDLTSGCTHLVCGTAEGVKYSRALAENITIVTPDWLVLSVQHGRLLDASAYHPRLLLGSGSEGLSSDLAAPGGSLDSLLSSITGFGGDSDIPERLATSGGGVGVQQPPVEVEQVASEQQKQQLLAKLKQTLPWNQQQMETSSVDAEEKSASNGSIFTSSSATTASSSSTSTLTSSQTGAAISLAEQTRRQLAIGQQSLPSDERSQHVKTSEVFDQAQRVQLTEVSDQKQHVQLTEVPDQKQHVQSMEVPDQKQHAHSTEVPDQKQHVEIMEMSDQKQNVQPTDVPDQKQHVHSMEVSEHQQESLCQVTTPQIASQTIQTESVQQASPVSLSQQQRQLEVQSKQLSYSTKLLQQLQQNPAPATVDSIRQSQLQAQSNVQQKLISPQQPQNRIQISQPIQRRMNSPQLQQPSQSPLQIPHQMQSPHQIQQIQQQSQSPQQIQQASQSPQQMQQPSQSPLQIQHQMQSPHQIQQIQQQSQSPQQIQHPNQSPQQIQQQMQSPQQIQHPNQSPQQMQQQIQSPQQFHQIQQPSQSPQQVQQQIHQIQQQNQSPQQIHQMQSPQQIQQIQQQMQSPQQIHQIQQPSQSPQQTQQQMQSPQQMQQQSQSPLQQMQSPQQQIQSPQQIQQQIQSSQQQMQSSQQAHQIQQQIQSPQQQIQQVQQQTQPAQPVSFNQQSQQQQFQTVPRLPTAQQPVGVEQLQAGGPAATGTASVGTQLQQQPGWRPQQLQQQTATGQRSVWIDERILQIQERLAGMEPQQRQQFLERMDPQQRNLFISHIHRQRLLQQQQQQQQQQWQLRQQGLIRVASVRPMQIRVPVTPATTTANAGSNTSANLQVAGQTAAAGVTRGQPVRQQTDTQQYGAQQQGEATVQSACVTPSTQVRQQSVAADVSEPIQQQVQENLEKIRQSLAAQQQQQQQLRQQPGAVTAQQQLAHRQLSASAASQSSTAVGSNGGQPQVRQHYVLRQAEPGQTVLTPGQRIIQVGNQQVVLPPGHTLTPEIRQQILNNQQNLVQTKTKTALANLLNNRLSSGASTPDTTPPTPPVSAPLQQQQQQQQQQVPVNHNVVSQCSVVSGSTVVQPGSRVVPAGSAVPVGPGSYRLGVNTLQKGVSGPVVQRVGAAGSQYIGHDPNLKLPPDLCLLGCVFLVCGYQRTTPLDELRAWCRTIVQYGGEVEQVYCSRVTHVLCFYSKNNLVQAAMRDGKRCVTAYWLNDVITQQKVSPPWLALHLPVPYGDNERPGQNMVISISGFEDRERQCVKYMVESVGARYTGYFTKHNTHLVCRRPEGAKFVKAREWKKPVVNVQWLNELMLGAHNVAMMCAHQRYQQYLAEPPAASLQHRQQMALRMDVSQVPHLMAAWKAPIVVTRDIWSRFKENPPPRNKRKFQELEEERSPASRALTTISTNITDPAATTLPSSGELSHHHQQQQSPLNTPVRVLFSAVECSRALADTVRQLGGVVTLDPRHCTHLVMGRPQRTVKLLLALPSCSHVLSQRWLVDSEREGRLLEEAPYSLCAPHGDGDDSTSSESRDGEAFEKRFGFSLAATMARTNRDKLFEGVSFYVTPGVVPRRRLLWRIIEASGGCVENRLRPLRTLREQAGTRSHVIITCDADLHLLDDVLKNGLPIYNAEFVLGAVLRQSLDYVVSSYVRHQC